MVWILQGSVVTLHYIFSVHLQSRPRTADITMA